MSWVHPVSLVGRRVRLEALSPERHLAGLAAIAMEASLWRWMPVLAPRDASDLRVWLDAAMQEQAEGRSLPFATVDLVSGRIAGSTRYLNVDERNRRVEIGWTWVGAAFQRTHVNTESKYLMLRHAFESLGCVRVELKANALNEPSRRAMERIGARYEGTLRRHMVQADGGFRDSVYYSVLDHEWDDVKRRLEGFMARA